MVQSFKLLQLSLPSPKSTDIEHNIWNPKVKEHEKKLLRKKWFKNFKYTYRKQTNNGESSKCNP